MKLLKFVTFLFFITFIFSSDVNAQERASASSAKIQNLKPQVFDLRVKVLEEYLGQLNSPLRGNARDFVSYADLNNLDWRLVAAISGVESTFGKQIPYNSYNAWGWGIYGSNTYSFKSWEDGIETISKGLRVDYINKWGAQDVYQIGRIYAASPTWAQKVTYFMNQIADFSLRNPQTTLSLAL